MSSPCRSRSFRPESTPSTTSQSEADEKRGREMRKQEEAQRRGRARMASERCRKGQARSRPTTAPSVAAALRCATSSTPNITAWGGALLSASRWSPTTARSSISRSRDGPLEPWVERHVMPYLDTVPDSLRVAAHEPRRAARTHLPLSCGRQRAADRRRLARGYRAVQHAAADRAGTMVEVPPLTFRLLPLQRLQHRGEQQGAAQCAARCARAPRSHRRASNEPYSAAVGARAPPLASIQVRSSSSSSVRHAPGRTSSDRFAVAPVGQHDCVCRGPNPRPIGAAQGRPGAAPRPWASANR